MTNDMAGERTPLPDDEMFRLAGLPGASLNFVTVEHNPIVTIHGDGRVELGADAERHYQADEAARAFWDAVIAFNPRVTALQRITALITAGDRVRTWVNHDDTCPPLPAGCTCGLDDAVVAWERAREGT